MAEIRNTATTALTLIRVIGDDLLVLFMATPFLVARVKFDETALAVMLVASPTA
jgi:hypothetical protein